MQQYEKPIVTLTLFLQEDVIKTSALPEEESDPMNPFRTDMYF